MKPAAVIFDAYGTLFDVHSIARALEVRYPGDGISLARLWREKQIDYSRLRTMSGRYVPFSAVTRDALRFAIEKHGVTCDLRAEDELLAGYNALDLFSENLAALDALSQQGIPLAILSNGDAGMLEAVTSHAGIRERFAHILSADTVACFKTAPQVYALAEAAFAVPAEEMIFVSSNCWDACGAAWYGFHTYWINRNHEPLEQLGVRPAGIGSDMSKLPDFVFSFATR